MPPLAPRYLKKRKYVGHDAWVRRKFKSGKYVPLRRRGAGWTKNSKVSKIAKSVALQLAEPKQTWQSFPFTPNIDGSTFTHDYLYACTLHDAPNNLGVLNIANGIYQNMRIGTDILLTGIKVRGVFNIPPDRKNVTIKMWLVEYNTVQGDATTYAEFFNGITGNGMLDNVNNDRFNAKLIRTLKLDPRDRESTTSASIFYNLWIPMRRKLVYRATGTAPVQGIKEKLQLIILPYDTTGTTAGDHIVTKNEQCVTVYFKDP